MVGRIGGRNAAIVMYYREGTRKSGDGRKSLSTCERGTHLTHRVSYLEIFEVEGDVSKG